MSAKVRKLIKDCIAHGGCKIITGILHQHTNNQFVYDVSSWYQRVAKLFEEGMCTPRLCFAARVERCEANTMRFKVWSQLLMLLPASD